MMLQSNTCKQRLLSTYLPPCATIHLMVIRGLFECGWPCVAWLVPAALSRS